MIWDPSVDPRKVEPNLETTASSICPSLHKCFVLPPKQCFMGQPPSRRTSTPLSLIPRRNSCGRYYILEGINRFYLCLSCVNQKKPQIQFNTQTEDKSRINFMHNTPMTGHTLKKQKDTLSLDFVTLLKYSLGWQRALCNWGLREDK